MTLIHCSACQADAPLTEYGIVFRCIPLTTGTRQIGHVAVLRHKVCDAMTSAVVKLTPRHLDRQRAESVYNTRRTVSGAQGDR